MPVNAPCFCRCLIPAGTLFVVMLLCLPAGNAQGPLTRHAISLAESGQLEEAEYKLAAAMATDEARDPMTWYVQAYVQKERFVARGKQAGDRGTRRVPFTPYRGSTLIEVPLSSTTRFVASASPSTSIATATSVLSGAMRRSRATSH